MLFSVISHLPLHYPATLALWTGMLGAGLENTGNVGRGGVP